MTFEDMLKKTLLMDGLIVIPWFLWETVTRDSRPRIDAILTVMEELQDSEYCHLVTYKKTKGFIKKFPLDSEKFF